VGLVLISNTYNRQRTSWQWNSLKIPSKSYFRFTH